MVLNVPVEQMLQFIMAHPPAIPRERKGRKLDSEGIILPRENAKQKLVTALLREDQRPADPGIWVLLDSLTERAVTCALSGNR